VITAESPMFCSTSLAERIERAEMQLICAATEAARARSGADSFVVPLAGGAACFAEGGSPMNKVVGLGFGGVPDAAALDEVEQRYASRGTAVQVEVSNLGDPEIAAALSVRGYRIVSFENVLGRPVAVEADSGPPGVHVRRCGDIDAWLSVVVDGFAHPDDQGVAAHEEFPRSVVRNATADMQTAGATPYLAYFDGAVAGGAGMRITGGVAQMTGAATAPAYRRRGVQTALLSARLTEAAHAGADIAVVTTQPGSKSQQNVQRRGFHLLYTRVILVNT
jgi:GNAT superfamily N-acetyltransferase